MATRYTSLRRSVLPLSSWVGGDWSTIPSRMSGKPRRWLISPEGQESTHLRHQARLHECPLRSTRWVPLKDLDVVTVDMGA
jgi:hypothetical protein